MIERSLISIFQKRKFQLSNTDQQALDIRIEIGKVVKVDVKIANVALIFPVATLEKLFKLNSRL